MGASSSVVRNLHFMAPLSAALANGDDTLSITADCYSTAGADAAITAALLAFYTSSQEHSVGRLPHRNGAGRGDGRRHHGRAAGLLHLLTSGAVGRLPHGERAEHAELSRRPGHGNVSSIALLAGKLGVTEAGGGRRRRADPGPHGRLTEKLDGPPQQRLQRGPGHAHRGSKRGRPHPDPGRTRGTSCAPQLNAWASSPLPAQHGLQLVVHVRCRQRRRPIVRQLCGRRGRLEHGQDVLTVPPNGVAKLHGRDLRTGSRRGCGPSAGGRGGAAADGGAAREGQPITRAALQRSCCAVREDCARGHGGAEHSGLGFLQGAWKMPIFPCFCMFFGRCHETSKMMKRDTPAFFLVLGAFRSGVTL